MAVLAVFLSAVAPLPLIAGIENVKQGRYGYAAASLVVAAGIVAGALSAAIYASGNGVG